MTRRPPGLLGAPSGGVVAVGLPVDASGARRYVVIGVAGRQAGLQNATVRRLAVPDVTAFYLAHKPVVLLDPPALRGTFAWRGPDEPG